MNPELALQWHHTLNGNLTPYNVACGGHKEVWWQCLKNPKHIWRTSIESRKSSKYACPFCSHHFPSEEYNLLVCNEELCKEWNYSRNDRNPEEYCPNSNNCVWWTCKDCGNEWETRISYRNKQKSGCPRCSKSKGEKIIKTILDSRGIYYIEQKEFIGLIGLKNGNLSYDFYLPKQNILIEYQGEFHDGNGGNYIKKNLKKQQEHDRRKHEYAIENNIYGEGMYGIVLNSEYAADKKYNYLIRNFDNKEDNARGIMSFLKENHSSIADVDRSIKKLTMSFIKYAFEKGYEDIVFIKDLICSLEFLNEYEREQLFSLLDLNRMNENIPAAIDLVDGR
jgi:hypothetical protein